MSSELENGVSFVVPPSPGPTGTMQGLLEDNRRLQEMLHLALRREAEALRKLKHLSEHLTEIRQSTSSCSTPTAPTPTDSMFRVDSPVGDVWEGSSDLSQGSDSIPLRFAKGALQPSNPPADSLTGLRRNSLSNPDLASLSTAPKTVRHTMSEHNLVCNGVLSGQVNWISQEMPCVTPRPCTMLAPSPRELRDVRTERERPPSLLRKAGPDRNISIPVEVTDRKYKTLDRKALRDVVQRRDKGEGTEQKESPGHRQRSRTTSSMLKPAWLRKRRNASSPTPRAPQSPETFDEMFARFLRSNSNLQPDPLAQYIGRHWSEVCDGCGGCGGEDKKYRDAVWELFQEECKYLTRQLRPLEQIYKGFLEELHFYGVLKVADTEKIFANLSELCELTASVAGDLFHLFEHRSGATTATPSELVLAFSMFGHKFNPVYQRFCVNFEKQRGFVKALSQVQEFQEYLRVCRGHEMVAKNDLTSLLIAPMQHQCHYTLLLEKVLKYTPDPSDKSVLSSAIKAFVVSLKELEANIVEHKRSLELLELQETICWPPLVALDPEAYIPEHLSSRLCSQSIVLASKIRQLLFRGSLRLLDSRARPSTELMVFLFTDLLLLTEQRSKTKRELTQYTVFRQPLMLAELEVHDIPSSPSPSSPSHLLTLVVKTSLGQRVAVYSLQASSKELKDQWLSRTLQAQDAVWHRRNPVFRVSSTSV